MKAANLNACARTADLSTTLSAVGQVDISQKFMSSSSSYFQMSTVFHGVHRPT